MKTLLRITLLVLMACRTALAINPGDIGYVIYGEDGKWYWNTFTPSSSTLWSFDGSGHLVLSPASGFATAAQGSKADSALQNAAAFDASGAAASAQAAAASDATTKANAAQAAAIASAASSLSAKILSGSGSLNFGTVTALLSTTRTITVTGAAVGDPVAIGIPDSAGVGALSIVTAWVSAADTVSVRITNVAAVTALVITTATWNVRVFK